MEKDIRISEQKKFTIKVQRTSFTITNVETGQDYTIQCSYKIASMLFLAVMDNTLFKNENM